MPGRLDTDRWSIELPDGWTAGQAGEQIQLVPPSGTAVILISDHQLKLSRATPYVVSTSLRSLLDSAKATEDRTEETPFSTEDGRLVAVGHGRAEDGIYCGGAIHAWPGTVVIVSFFEHDHDVRARNEANQLLLSLRRRETTSPLKSRLGKLLGR
jgi:hypothetical protein